MSETLDALTFPLWGSRLIEASAGTGKTWTIAALYLRLVLGHGDANGFARPLVPAEILVMTFTRAATRELSDRIRSRLLEAARCFRGEAQPAPDDALLMDLLAGYCEGSARMGAAWRLAMAAESMDDAAVHTIDAWCQRMLREHAFDSGCLFDEELTANERAMQIEAAQDYWRQQFYPMSGDALDVALGVWKNVEALTDDARELLNQALPEEAPKESLADLIERLTAERGAAMAALKVGWSQRAHEMQAWLDQQLAGKACPFDKRKLAARYYTPWLETLAAWAADSLADVPDMKTGATRLTPAGMQEVLKPGASVELPDHFAAFEQLMQDLGNLPAFGSSLRLHAAACISRRVSDLKSQAGTFGFADMLTRLDNALNADLNGANAERLRTRILSQYPVALVDEFQDTSPVQSRIFDRLYRTSHNDPATALLLIGDPKQSIYGFRGADIYSYLTARRATVGRHYVLGTNHRSTVGLVTAVNHLFAAAEARDGEAAFMFRTAGAAAAAAVGAVESHGCDNPLPFVPVNAKGRAEAFVTSAGPSPALTLNLDARLLDTQTSVREFAARCAERIVMLLNDPDAGFEHPRDGFSRLRPADIAVLVRTGKEAAAVRRELRRRRVASVYLSDKDSVFDSGEARDLLHWLKAVAAPLDVRLARAALATRTVGLSIEELAVLATDDEAFDARSEQLRQLHAIWQSQGVLTMLRQTLHMLDLPARWLGSQAGSDSERAGQAAAEADGERRLTNVLHLAELLQAASAQLDGEQALIRWLANQIDGDSTTGDEQIVRLESDADLVKVVTVHKSKGLEYPLVFLPFACSFRGVDKARTRFVSLADEQGQRGLHLAPTDEQIAAADKERQREDLRLLYVALTRARHALWVGLAALKVGPGDSCTAHRSAIGYVLFGSEQVHPDTLMPQLETLIKPCADIVLVPVEDAEQVGRTPLQLRGEPIALREPALYTASFERRWSIGSFSALVRTLPTPFAWSASSAAMRDDELLEPSDATSQGLAAATLVDSSPASTPGSTQPWHSFPRGAVPGNFLHEQLEWLAGEGFELDASTELQQQLLRRCDRQGWGHRGQDVLAWLMQVVKTPLPPVGAALGAITAGLPEMEFWFPSDGLMSDKVDALCRSHLLGGSDRPALPERELRGMLMGFADIVFEHAGKYWVLDYKSNYLGANDADYAEASLEAAMAVHRYDVQAALYLLALHRLLQARLGAGYDPVRQLGGAVYFFMRGIQGPCNGCYHVQPPMELLVALDALFRSPEEIT
jgi:exodeoxyribonuclease V beta subunit